MVNQLVLVRHGQSEWVRQNRFAGWADAPLSEAGRREATQAGNSLLAAGLRFDQAACSLLSRSSETLAIMLKAMAAPELPVIADWRLNERHYGRLQGMNRVKASVEFGQDKVTAWRRDYRARPPTLDPEDPGHPARDEIYAAIDPVLLPGAESLEDAALRVVPFWEETLAPDLRAGKRVLLVAHTASIRGLMRILGRLSDPETEAFRIATALPLLLTLDQDLALVDQRELPRGARARLRHFLAKTKPKRLIPWI